MVTCGQNVEYPNIFTVTSSTKGGGSVFLGCTSVAFFFFLKYLLHFKVGKKGKRSLFGRSFVRGPNVCKLIFSASFHVCFSLWTKTFIAPWGKLLFQMSLIKTSYTLKKKQTSIAIKTQNIKTAYFWKGAHVWMTSREVKGQVQLQNNPNAGGDSITFGHFSIQYTKLLPESCSGEHGLKCLWYKMKHAMDTVGRNLKNNINISR